MDEMQNYKDIVMLKDRINDLNARLSYIIDILNSERKEEIEAITPYTETKALYIGDTEVTFFTDKTGNLTVYFPYEYTVNRLNDRIIISFDELEEVTNITISIL